MKYFEKQFLECSFNPLTTGKMLELYPRLSEITEREWHTGELDSLLRYTIMVYDPKSPLHKGEKDLHERKHIAAELSNFDSTATVEVVTPIGLQDVQLLQAVFECTHPFIVALTIRFLQHIVKSKEYALVVVNEFCFWEGCQKSMEPITGKNNIEDLQAHQKKTAINEEMDKILDRIDKYTKMFFGEDEVLEKKAKQRVTPENVALLSKVK